MFILYYIPENNLEQERIVRGVFSTKDKLLKGFSRLKSISKWSKKKDGLFLGNNIEIKSSDFILHNLDIEKDFDGDNSYVYEKVDVDKILW